MTAAPFLAGKPASGHYFVGRDRILRSIDTIMAGTADGVINNVMLLGQRKMERPPYSSTSRSGRIVTRGSRPL